MPIKVTLKSIYVVLFCICQNLCFGQQVILLQDDFNDNASGWIFSNNNPHDWRWYNDQGNNDTGGLRMKLPFSDASFASPSVYLEAGKTYSCSYKARVIKGTNSRKIIAAFNTTPNTTGATVFSEIDLPINGYTQLPFTEFNPTFSVPTSGNYHLIFWGENGAYFFTYFDDFLIEETQLPSVNITSPTNGSQTNEFSTLNFSAIASDPDGSVETVIFKLNDEIVFEDATSPYSFSKSDLLPGNYELVAQSIDNKGNLSMPDTVNFRVNFSDGSFGKYIDWNFNDGLDYWTLKNGNWRPRSGFQGSSALELFSAYDGNFAASTAFHLLQGESYNLSFLNDIANAPDSVKVYLNTKPELGGQLLNTFKFSSTDNFNVLRSIDFQVNQSADYYIVLQYNGVRNYIQLRFDNIRIRGNLNRGAFTSLTKPDKEITSVKGAGLLLSAEAYDTDGTVQAIEFYANDSLLGTVNTSPYEFYWPSLALGNYELYAKGVDNEGGKSRSLGISLNVQENILSKSTFIGNKPGDNEVRSAIIQDNGAIILAANLDSLAIDASKLQNFGGLNAKGYLIKLSADGSEIIKAIKLASKISDMAKDSLGNLYVAGAQDGLFKIDKNLNGITWQKTFSRTVHRVDVSKKGNSVILLANETDINDLTLLNNTAVNVYNKDGTLISNATGASQYTTDVAIDDKSETYVVTGYKNFNTFSFLGDTRFLPVFVPVIVGRNFDGTQKYRAYDWIADSTSNRWLNRSENNMADLKATRCSMGKDGKLYVMFNVYGGNHAMRYDPFDINLPVTIVGGDNYFNLSNTGTETKITFGKYNIADGSYIIGQQLTNRLSSPPFRGNSIFGDGEIQADEEGRVYITGKSAAGLPMTVDHRPGDYNGGAFMAIISPNFALRENVIRLTNGEGKALGLRNKNHWVIGGLTSNALYQKNAISPQLSGQNAWFAINSSDNPCPQKLVIPFTVEKQTNSALDSISSIEQIPINSSKYYTAGKSITLEPGFKAAAGATFQAVIAGCVW